LAVSLPLPALLSQALVAFTIEFDNEFEHQMPHRTAMRGPSPGAGGGPWLVSMVMWWNCMRFVGEAWMPVAELVRLAGTETNLPGMQRWGYIQLAPRPNDARAKPPQSDLLVRSTSRGRKAQELWRPLDAVVVRRWEQRFGAAAVDALRTSLTTLVSRLGADLPDCLPILRYGLVTRGPATVGAAPAGRDAAGLPLPALLARPLVAFAVEFEAASDLSLAICANLLRVLGEDPVPLRDLPLRSGVSKESVSMALGVLDKRRLVVAEPDPNARGRVIRLTPAGRRAQEASRRLITAVEKRWVKRFGAPLIGDLRTVLEGLAGEAGSAASLLFGGLQPYPDGWRAFVPKPEVLPHFPMVLHRGGYPDGS
jgi:DNA-binding MarR family transcriptional regulator